jgi:DNA invertase Pin-like site-specific DNA recombinase
MKAETGRPRLRCAIYTRVSTEQGLEQEFNSLDNQREASEAYVQSQAHEGWGLIRIRYDDGGYSGGLMERPALKRLLDDVRTRRLDVIVVYKVDRLTRSLSDFAKLVELFDAHNVSFISVTQAFNTTTSMGRLTLNMLLSFAQFEREVTGERIRDKVAASKKRGIWMGGAVPLGYRVENHALHLVEHEAEFVRRLFRRYLEIGSVVRVKTILDEEIVTSPVRISRAGRRTGGVPMSRGHLYWILSNPIYVGRLRHKGQVHDGLHPAIVDQETWNRVQQRLAAQTQARRARAKDEHSFLAGRLFDDRGNRMGATYTAKGSRRWRYYVSRAVLTGSSQGAGPVVRVSAPVIENCVVRAIAPYLAAQTKQRRPILRVASENKGLTQGQAEHVSHDAIRSAIERVTLSASRIEIILGELAINEGRDRVLTIPWTPRSSHRQRVIIHAIDQSDDQPRRRMRNRARQVFIDAMRDAHCWLNELFTNPTTSVGSLSIRVGRSERSIRMTLSLAFLAPELAKAATDARLPRGFGIKRLIDLPMLWSEQWRALGLQAPSPPDLHLG